MSPNDDLNYGETLRGLRQGMQVFDGRYVLKRRLGRGGMGEVWLAEDLELERGVALKFLPELIARDPTAVRDLKREARRALDLTHENIVRVYDFLADDFFAAISMEFVDGESLASLRSKHDNGYFEWDEIKLWLPELFSALTYAHERAGVVHRDLKPANILISKTGTLKVVDFGISSSITDTVSSVSVQSSSAGTPVYMSPQQMMGEDPSFLDDVYSLGATLYELLTGKPPFYSGNIFHQVQSKVAPAVSERRDKLSIMGKPIPEKLSLTISACLAKEAFERPESVIVLSNLLIGNSINGISPYIPRKGQDWTVPELGLELIWIEPGEFLMGSPESEVGRKESELQHLVKISNGYWLGKYEVTQGEWESIMGNSPIPRKEFAQRAPVDAVSWEDAMAFCKKLTVCERRADRLPANLEYCLPTEAEWEYACRAGTTGPFHYGSSLNSSLANFDGRFPYGNGDHGVYRSKRIEVGSFEPNSWGFYDMHGNVSEWCLDYFGDYPRGSVTDPRGPSIGTKRSVRGGDWMGAAWMCRSAYRWSSLPTKRFSNNGFRLALRKITHL